MTYGRDIIVFAMSHKNNLIELTINYASCLAEKFMFKFSHLWLL